MKKNMKKKTKLILSIVGLVVFAGVIFFGTLYFVDAKSKITTSAGSYNVEKNWGTGCRQYLLR